MIFFSAPSSALTPGAGRLNCSYEWPERANNILLPNLSSGKHQNYENFDTFDDSTALIMNIS